MRGVEAEVQAWVEGERLRLKRTEAKPSLEACSPAFV